jgi:hypothetical protein
LTVSAIGAFSPLTDAFDMVRLPVRSTVLETAPMKMMAFVLVLCAAVTTMGQARPANCQVRPLWVIKGGPRSANLGAMGEFRVDGREGATVRSFKFQETGMVITGAVDYQFDYSGPKARPSRVAVAITVSDQEKKEIFESVDSSEASTSFHKDWNLQVTKSVFSDNRIYIFNLSCRDGSTR